MRRLNKHLLQRTLLIVAIALVIATLMSGLELTAWALQINKATQSHSPQESEALAIPLMYLLPFIKVLLFAGVPMALTIGLHRLVGKRA
ncbi:MAG: hypothetical protein ACJAWL_001228 [Motiliproteus sp.]|jgi:hypothetical protein